MMPNRAIASSSRFAVGRAVVFFGCPGYNPSSFSPAFSKPPRTCNSNTVSKRKPIVNRRRITDRSAPAGLGVGLPGAGTKGRPRCYRDRER